MKDALGHGSNAHNEGIEGLPTTAYELAKAHRAKLEAESARTGAIMDTFPRGPMGLTPDHVRATPEWQAAKNASATAFAALREHNGKMNKYFKKEMKADRDRVRAARIAK